MSNERLEVEAPLPIPDFLVGEVRSKMAYVDSHILAASVEPTRVVLELAPGFVAEEVRDKVSRAVRLMAEGARKPRAKVVEDRLDVAVPFAEDPLPLLRERGELFEEAGGIATCGPLLTRLIDYFEGEFLGLARSFEALPYRFPSLVPARWLNRVGYFNAFPHSLGFVSHLQEDLDGIDRFAAEACCEGHRLVLPEGSLAAPQTLLSPAVCYHLYFALADKPLPGGSLTATAVGHCFRYEGINLRDLERLWNFQMREIIFVGPAEWVLAQRQAGMERMQERLHQWGLAYRVETANDPFFIGEFQKQAAFQTAFQLKYEIRARLPFRGSTLAVGSYNFHQDFFGRHLNITLPDGTPASTGCVAFGLERLALAFLAQFGLDPAGWPPCFA